MSGSGTIAEIKVEDLTIGYGRRVIMEHLDFEVKRGECVDVTVPVFMLLKQRYPNI